MRRSHHVDLRGNTHNRRVRRAWLLKTFGNGRTVACYHCGRRMRSAFEVDRWPVCGHKGGRYVRTNIVPACRRCNRNHKCNRSLGGAMLITKNGVTSVHAFLNGGACHAQRQQQP